MPTGYTAGILNNEINTFEEFAMECAKAFGACITLRDNPNSDIPEKFEYDTYYLDALNKAKKEFEKLRCLNDDEIKIAAETDYRQRLNFWEERQERKRKDKIKLQALLNEVLDWVPPTEDHTKLKFFMIDQLEKTISFDCDNSYDKKPVEELPFTWWKKKIDDLLNNITRYTEEHKAEIKRVDNRNKWLKELRESLKRENVNE